MDLKDIKKLTADCINKKVKCIAYGQITEGVITDFVKPVSKYKFIMITIKHPPINWHNQIFTETSLIYNPLMNTNQLKYMDFIN